MKRPATCKSSSHGFRRVSVIFVISECWISTRAMNRRKEAPPISPYQGRKSTASKKSPETPISKDLTVPPVGFEPITHEQVTAHLLRIAEIEDIEKRWNSAVLLVCRRCDGMVRLGMACGHCVCDASGNSRPCHLRGSRGKKAKRRKTSGEDARRNPCNY